MPIVNQTSDMNQNALEHEMEVKTQKMRLRIESSYPQRYDFNGTEDRESLSSPRNQDDIDMTERSSSDSSSDIGDNDNDNLFMMED
jgi:hypothetical protein